MFGLLASVNSGHGVMTPRGPTGMARSLVSVRTCTGNAQEIMVAVFIRIEIMPPRRQYLVIYTQTGQTLSIYLSVYAFGSFFLPV